VSDRILRPSTPVPDWSTVNARVAWLVRTRFDDNRTALAKAIGFSHTVIANVMKGKPPGRRLLEAITARLSVDPAWLRTGDGQPFLAGGTSESDHLPDGAAVTTVPLPGPPLLHQGLITGRWVSVPGVTPSRTAYWLELRRSEPLAQMSGSGFRPRDRLLVESDPAGIPREQHLADDLCVLRWGAAGTDLRLGWVSYQPASVDDSPARLEVDFPETSQPKLGGGVDHILRQHPDGEIEYVRQPHRRVNPTTQLVPPTVKYADIVGVWLRILHRPVG
jgi:hypothetical protein